MGTGAPTQMTGWSARWGAVSGSLRDFAIGAVIQHFTKSLARKEHQDFELPSEHQLDVLEAFQLSLGRTADMDLSRSRSSTRNSTPAKGSSSTAVATRRSRGTAISVTRTLALSRPGSGIRTATSTRTSKPSHIRLAAFRPFQWTAVSGNYRQIRTAATATARSTRHPC